MKLRAHATPYSSIVGGGLSLLDDQGRIRFLVMFTGTTEGITPSETKELTDQFMRFVNEHGLKVDDRPRAALGEAS